MTVLVTKNTANNTMCSVQEPHTFLSSIFLLHSSTNEPAILSLH